MAGVGDETLPSLALGWLCRNSSARPWKEGALQQILDSAPHPSPCLRKAFWGSSVTDCPPRRAVASCHRLGSKFEGAAPCATESVYCGAVRSRSLVLTQSALLQISHATITAQAGAVRIGRPRLRPCPRAAANEPVTTASRTGQSWQLLSCDVAALHVPMSEATTRKHEHPQPAPVRIATDIA